MSKTIIITQTLSVFALLLMGVSSASASEVTGTLSSGIGGNSAGGGSETSGTLNSSVEANTIGGTVTSGGSSGGGGGNSSGGGSGGGNQGIGQVLGLSDSATTDSPSFPNAGFDPGDGDEEDFEVWGTLMVLALAAGLTTFAAKRYQNKVN